VPRLPRATSRRPGDERTIAQFANPLCVPCGEREES
jgi:hypothetical protein